MARMATALFLVRFFRVVPAVTPHIVGCLWVVATGGAAALAAGIPGETALAPLLVLQIFAASSGFTPAARRGYYDVLLTRGISRMTVLCAHWVASIAPGLLAWGAVAATERLIRPEDAAALTSGSIVALALASTIPWAVTAPLPRFAAAIGWLLFLTTAQAAIPSGQADLVSALRAPASPGVAAFALVVYPMGALGMDLTAVPIRIVGPAVLVAAVSVAAALFWCGRRDTPLEAAQ